MADTGNGRVRRIAGDTVSTLLHAGITAPSGLAFDPTTNTLFVADSRQHNIYALSVTAQPPVLRPLLRDAVILEPARIAVHAGAGHLAVTCRGAHAVLILLVGCVSRTQPCVCVNQYSLQAGPCVLPIGSMDGPGHVDGDFSSARLWSPSGVAFDSHGSLYIADTGNDAVRLVVLPGPADADASSYFERLQQSRIVTLSGPGRHPIALRGPAALALAADGQRLFVADTGCVCVAMCVS